MIKRITQKTIPNPIGKKTQNQDILESPASLRIRKIIVSIVPSPRPEPPPEFLLIIFCCLISDNRVLVTSVFPIQRYNKKMKIPNFSTYNLESSSNISHLLSCMCRLHHCNDPKK